MNINDPLRHPLGIIYREAIEKNNWVFAEWFPNYEQDVLNYRKQASAKSWTDNELQRLLKDTSGNGISDLQQKNFEWDEYEQIKANWFKIQDTFQAIVNNNIITTNEYKTIFDFFRSFTNQNRYAATNRVIAAHLPNVVTTTVTQNNIKYIITRIQKICPDYPSSINWLTDNLNFIQYCNQHITFDHPWHSSVFAWYLKIYFEKKEEEKKEKTKAMVSYINLLKANKNLVLTGAPGTGKTYLAKQLAISLLFNKMEENDLTDDEKKIFEKHFSFVQFHPSYDYTDFVEGLRAENLNGQVIFNLHNGIFKDFCKKAIAKTVVNNFDEEYDNFINDILENDFTFETPKHKKKFKVEINSNNTCVAIPSTNKGTRLSITKEILREYVLNDNIKDWKPYVTSLGNYFRENYTIEVKDSDNQNLPFIFVIDEINRGEISKIFGELFFSIDPGYRGEAGKVKTQYTNIQSNDTIFDYNLGQGWFYVPKNVYIIGTMNDIDRSVESMDFAMRRRFAWKEIKSIDQIQMWNGQIDLWKDDAKKRMDSLNSKIEEIQGLGPAYHIGPSYFLALKNYNGNFKELWNNHLEGILQEYLRGLPNISETLVELNNAYNLIAVL